MDYEIFLLSRIHEAWVRTGDARASVTHALEITARVITCAALIMVSVFAAFIISDNIVVKMLGLGLAASVLIDATVVRLLLVPAVMTLLGRAAWWIPRPLDRILPHLDAEGGAQRVRNASGVGGGGGGGGGVRERGWGRGGAAPRVGLDASFSPSDMPVPHRCRRATPGDSESCGRTGKRTS
ncbi:hypothetical protein SCYAM73S_04991 [Streptomyces cyaneofuscatus]